ncbi:hypothetical protein EV368DRAFT_42422, partial [Lentinula lateritia]
RDEDFDQSYEGLMSLAATLGEVKPRATPDHVVAGLKTGFYKDWASDECDKRCPICLDDYKSLDPVLKLNDCSHWLHKSCLEVRLRHLFMNGLRIFIYCLISNGLKELVLVLFVVNLCKR